MNQCRTCAWMVDVSAPGSDPRHPSFTCRRRAPVLVTLASRDGITRLTEWPPVSPELGCGDHTPK